MRTLIAFCLLAGCLAVADQHTHRHKTLAGRPKVDQCATDRRTCHNLHTDSVKAINLQINAELTASYVYQSMAYYFARDDVALHGFAKFFQASSDEEREHGQMFMDYLNKRGGQMVLSDIPKPVHDEWGNGIDAMEEALKLEHDVSSKILDVHWIAQEHNDAHLTDYLEGNFVNEQVDSVKEIANHITRLRRMRDNPVGEYLYDNELLEKKANMH